MSQAAVISEGTARGDKKLNALTLKSQYPEHLTNNGQKLNVFISSRRNSSGSRSMFSFSFSNIYPHSSIFAQFTFCEKGFSWPTLATCIWHPTDAQQQQVSHCFRLSGVCKPKKLRNRNRNICKYIQCPCALLSTTKKYRTIKLVVPEYLWWNSFHTILVTWSLSAF